jgi:hypothetical protein
MGLVVRRKVESYPLRPPNFAWPWTQRPDDGEGLNPRNTMLLKLNDVTGAIEEFRFRRHQP